MDFVLNFILIKGSEICALIPYCGYKDSIEHTFIECLFTRSFAKNVIQWFNGANCCQISPTPRELLFGITPGTKGTKIIKKIKYATLSMRHYIYSNKINSNAFKCTNSSINYLLSTIQKISINYNKIFKINVNYRKDIL